MVLLYDLLLGKGIQCGGPLKRLLTSHKAELLTALKSSTKKHSKAVKSTGIILLLQLSCNDNYYYYNLIHDCCVNIIMLCIACDDMVVPL